MFPLLLVTVIFWASSGNALHIIIDSPGYGCNTDRPLIEAIDKFHNKLRQRVAYGDAEINGREFGPERQMYALVYDCGLEAEAEREKKLPGYADLYHRGVVRFSGDYKGSTVAAVEKILKTLYDDENAMKQITYQKATHFGCTGTPKKGTQAGYRRMEWICVYDKKPQDGESVVEGNYCTEDKDCTFYKDSFCEWDLCYARHARS
ncbi:hypothetical protein Y032_0222g2621 [Ancylostoma ceylanicum]|uniref:SCP domain-containing protein n=1 Tax=Ancylostoma ceylanicum TaxID=53326 RepID=A0A016SIR3_9BILA|nr:hypothetical protein Y032_0222g2621 [Ancylostoma ceylanicum]